MIRIYDSKTDDFFNNGLGILKDFKTSPQIVEALNGNFELEFDYARNGQYSEYLVVDNIIKAPYDGTEQLFRIKRVKPSLKKINIYAVHIFYDLADNFLTDVSPTNKSAVNAIAWLLEHTMFDHKFKVTGDDSDINTARYVRKNPIEAILGADNSILNRWGGDIERDNFNIIYHRERGNDNGVYLKQGKNIKEIEISIDFSTVVTRVVPQGANELLLPEYSVDSPLINTYRNPIVKKYEFSDISEDDTTTKEEAYKKLREAANKLFSESNIDKPTISVSVDWLDLTKTEKYKEYTNLERVSLGDYVTVKALGYEYKIRIIKVTYDCILDRFVSFEIGEAKADYVSNTQKSIASEIQKSSSSLIEQAKQAATSLINNGFGGNVRVYNDRIYIMDTNDESTAKKVWQWNLNGFGFSKNGIEGPYETAITMDGSIVANFITSGKLSTDRIEGFKELLLTVNSNKKEVDTLKSSIKLFTVEFLSDSISIPVSYEKKVLNDFSYEFFYYPYFKGQNVTPNSITIQEIDNIKTKYDDQKVTISIPSGTILKESNYLKIIFKYIDEDQVEYTYEKNIQLNLSIAGSPGKNGEPGTPGKNGENGASTYCHIKYSEDNKTFSGNEGKDPARFKGVYFDDNPEDSDNFDDYVWTDTQIIEEVETLKQSTAELLVKSNSVDISISEAKNQLSNLNNQLSNLSGAISSMNFSFRTEGLHIGNPDNSINSLLDNTGVKVYNSTKLISIINKNGAGFDNLIVTKSLQFQNLKAYKRTIDTKRKKGREVISFFWQENLISSLEDLEKDD